MTTNLQKSLIANNPDISDICEVYVGKAKIPKRPTRLILSYLNFTQSQVLCGLYQRTRCLLFACCCSRVCPTRCLERLVDLRARCALPPAIRCYTVNCSYFPAPSATCFFYWCCMVLLMTIWRWLVDGRGLFITAVVWRRVIQEAALIFEHIFCFVYNQNIPGRLRKSWMRRQNQCWQLLLLL